MIEKPKRPKKPDIQERQPPRTLQELISRYDLDNTKIYDFLDGLVELINTDIDNLNNQKVNKVINITSTGTNLNDYKTEGIYYFSPNYTPTNIPIGVNGWLKVIPGNDGTLIVKQIWYRHGTPNSNDYETYVRTFSSNIWSNWKMIGMQSSIDSLNNSKVNKSGDTMTGDLNMQNNPIRFGSDGNIYWKEDGYGDKFRILPNFSGSGSSNKLVIQSTNGDAGTDPTNWKDLVYIHADSGEINLLDLITANRINLNNVLFPNNAYSPKYFQMTWGTTMTVATEVGGHGLIFTSNQALYIFWIAGGNHDQLSVNTVWGNSNHCNITMPDNAHIRVATRNGDNMTCTILFFKNQ